VEGEEERKEKEKKEGRGQRGRKERGERKGRRGKDKGEERERGTKRWVLTFIFSEDKKKGRGGRGVWFKSFLCSVIRRMSF
jgi:hypothetical protein